MHKLPWVAALLAVTVFGSSPARGADRGWSIELGGGSVQPSTTSGFAEASGVHAAALLAVRPWLLVGGSASGNTFTPVGVVSIPEVRTIVGRTRIAALSAVARVQPHVRVGPAPFAALEAGYARAHFGDLAWDGSSFGYPSGRTVGAIEWGPRMAAGVGVRMVVPGGWPGFEVSAQAVTLGLRSQLNYTEMRAALTY